uniref:Mitochondrial import inner membrane translocase subunit TIM16-like n=1 Tax=Taeniopygia guttata TaxID=59729 RepID=A0A674GBY6_TAEGU
MAAHGERGRGSRAPPAGGPPARGHRQRALWARRGRSARAAAVSVPAVPLPGHVSAGRKWRRGHGERGRGHRDRAGDRDREGSQGRGKKSWGGGQRKEDRARESGAGTEEGVTGHGHGGQRQGTGERAWGGNGVWERYRRAWVGAQGQRRGDRARSGHDRSQTGSEQSPGGWGEVTEPMGLCRAQGEVTGHRSRGGCDSRVSPQAKYLAQIILVGAQVVGRAFMRALRQEFAGRSWGAALCAHAALLGTAPHPHPSLGTPALPIPCRGHCQVVTGLHPGTAARHPRGQSGVIPGMWQPQPCLVVTNGACLLPATSLALGRRPDGPGVAGWGQRGTAGSEHLEVRGLCCLRAGWQGTQALLSPASQAAANARGRTERPQSAAASRIISISLQEAQQILNVSSLNPEEIQKNYDHLFKVNDKSVGGSFYLQSKVVRAKERLDEELRIQAKGDKEKGRKAET